MRGSVRCSQSVSVIDGVGCSQEVLRWVMTRAQSRNSKAGRAGTLSLEERTRKLEVQH